LLVKTIVRKGKNPTMSYQADRIERRNRRKAIVITTLLYGGLLTFFLVKDDISWSDYLPEVVLEMIGEDTPDATVATSTEIRP
jgi:hypothetical protein